MFRGIAGTAQLRILTEMPEEYCLVHGLVSDVDRELAAVRVIAA